MSKDIESKVRAFVVETFLFGQGGDELGDEDSLLERGVIDSTGILEVVSFLESDFELKVLDEELVPDNFDSIAKVAAFVRGKTQEKPWQDSRAMC